MRSYFQKRAVQFLQREDGPAAVEYAIVLALIITVCVGSVTLLAGRINSIFTPTVGSASS